MKTALVVVPRRLGDVLLATPVIRSLRIAFPAAAIDALVNDGTAGVLAGNPDVTRILAFRTPPGLAPDALTAARILRRYDVALSLVPSDRSTIFAALAGRISAGLATGRDAWKRRWLSRAVDHDWQNTHTVRMNLAVLAPLGVTPHADVVSAWSAGDEAAASVALGLPEGAPFAVIHPTPMFRYKEWTAEGWVALAAWLREQGLGVVLTGGGDEGERRKVAAIAGRVPGVSDLSGRLSLAEVACLLARARLYCGPDTVVTHMAAAAGIPVVALFGPSNPVAWGPWPKGFPADRNPWRRVGTQRQGNVLLLQGEAPCAPGVPCLHEGCERHRASRSDCLDHLPAARVIAAAREMLA
jgi:heptosyltransferase-3